MNRWCVRHRDGWCATASNRPHWEEDNNVPTRCGHFVVLPWGSAYREPTCGECLAAKGGKGES